jgi:hypothetical protein
MQLHVGEVLERLAMETEADPKSKEVSLRESAAAYRAALSDLTPSQKSSQEGTVQYELGTVLGELSETESPGTGRQDLGNAILILTKAVDAEDLIQKPRDWSHAMMILGIALLEYGANPADADLLCHSTEALATAWGGFVKLSDPRASSAQAALAKALGTIRAVRLESEVRSRLEKSKGVTLEQMQQIAEGKELRQ